ncbi:MAG: adenylate kinase [Propionibacteriaceae bacterium]|jgi:adenylate kinase|nr:adenylate kinase [Propionibacteriaceae bacterium]
MRLLIVGPPGVGKGTQAKGIAEHYGVPAISTGDMFRAMKSADTPLARQVQQIMNSGALVPDEITDAIVADRLSQPDARGGWLLDGYPRNLGQVDALDQALAGEGASIDAVVSLTADEDVLVARLLQRAEIEGRADDNAETIANRMRVYREATDPLLSVYRDRGLLVEVDGVGEIAEVAGRITAALDAKLA